MYGLKKTLWRSDNKAAVLAAIIASITVLLLLVMGCNGGGQGTYNSQKANDYAASLTYDDFGRPIIRYGSDQGTSTSNKIKVDSPPNAKTPTTFRASDDGIEAGVGASYEPAAIDWTRKNGVIFYYAAIGLMVAGLALAFVPVLGNSPPVGFGLRGLGVALLVAAGFCAFTPTIIDKIGALVAGTVFVFILAIGAFYVYAHRDGIELAFKKSKERGNVLAAGYAAQGRTEEAIAARRSADPSYSAAVASAKAAAADPLAALDPAVPIVPPSNL